MPDDAPRPTVPVPPDVDEWDPERAYLTGAQVMADLVVNAMHTLRPELEPPDTDDAADDAAECRTCGAPTLASMGADETDHTPAGRVCPECDR